MTDHFVDAFVRENVARIFMTLWQSNDAQKLDADAILFEKPSVRKGISND